MPSARCYLRRKKLNEWGSVMNYKNRALRTLVILFLPACICFGNRIQAETPMLPVLNNQLVPAHANNHHTEKYISFKYDEEDLINVINYLAAEKGINILLPTGPNKLEAKLTLHHEKKLSLQEAWKLLGTTLDVAGFSMVPKGDMYQIVKNSKDIAREPMPVYINTAPNELPNSDQRIRYVYYLTNIKVTDQDTEFKNLLKELLPIPDTTSPPYKIDTVTNSLILMGKANDIKAAMHIIQQVDQPGFQEKMDYIKLHHSSAKIVANLFNQSILKQPNEFNRYRLDTQKQSDATYFSRYTRIIADERTNMLIILGRPQAINRLKEFIRQNIDVELDSGKSILHVYQLQYLEAKSFAEVLKKIVTSEKEGAAQAEAAKKAAVGPEQFFEDVKITTDTPPPAETTTGADPKVPAPTPYYGGNKLIIAARNDDWRRIKKLIEELDTPRPQVLIEVLIVDLTLDDARALGSLIRNPAKIPLPNEVNFQSAQLEPGVIPDSFENPKTIGVQTRPDCTTEIASDLLRDSVQVQDSTVTKFRDPPAANTSAAGIATPGSTIISLNDNDGKTWGILQIIQTLGYSKILSHPYVIATHNHPAEVTLEESRLVDGSPTFGTGGNTIRKQDRIPAKLNVHITPRISYGKEAPTVNLTVAIDINEFIGGTDARTTRNITTEANVHDGGILALGGLIKTNLTQGIKKTPLLADAPIIGWLFKQRSGETSRTNLTVFISPIVIQPRLREGLNEATKDFVQLADEYAREGTLFDSLRDPITRWFFKTGTNEAVKIVDNYLKKDELKRIELPRPAQIPPPPEPPERRKRKRRFRPEPAKPSEPDWGDKKQYADELKRLVQNDDNPFNKNKKNTAPAA